MEISTPSVLKKSKRLTSVVWNDFERVKRGDVCFAVCKLCKKKLSGSSTSGTSNLWNHLIRCRKRFNQDIAQQLRPVRENNNDGTVDLGNLKFDQDPGKVGAITFGKFEFDQEVDKDGGAITLANFKFGQEQKNGTVNLENFKFDQERSRLNLSRMIILHGYPLAMVEHVGFKVFVKDLQPMFNLTACNTVEADCIEIYENEKRKVTEMFDKLPGRIGLTADMWASGDSGGYLRLTAVYIDQAWQLQKRILNFVKFDSSYTEDVLSENIMTCLMNWVIDRKLFSMTLDDFSTHDNVVFRVRDRLSQNRLLFCNGKLFNVRCAVRILNLIAQVALEAIPEVTHKIRESIRHVKSSQEIQVKFDQLVQEVPIQSPRSLCLDNPLRWNSTYLMLEVALEYRDVFSLLQDHDSTYMMAPSDTEWERLSAINKYLKLFYEVTNAFSSSKLPTSNIYFPEICAIYMQLIEHSRSSDFFIASTASKMKDKFEKYWKTCSLVLAIAVILDPRFKMKLVEYYYSQIYGSSASDQVKDVYDGIKDLYNEYMMRSTLAPLDQDLAWGSQSCSGFSGAGLTSGSNDRLSGFDKFLHETSQSHHVLSDLDKYLEEPVYPRNIDFNILNWWKVQTPRFPILSMIARDVLGIPMSTHTLDSAFNNGSRVLDPYWNSLNPDTVQALICTKDWLQTELQASESCSSHSASSTLCINGN